MKRILPRFAALSALALAVVSLAGCGSSGDFSSQNSSGSSTESASAVNSLPADFQAAYTNLNQPVGSTPYVGDWKPRGNPPWTIGYASPYSGNSWQTYAMDRLMKDLVPKYKAAGLIRDVVVTQSNLDDTVQNQQIRQLVDQNVDIIITCCSSVTALNQSIQYAHDKGVPFVSYSGYVNSPFAVNTSANYHEAGRIAAEALFKQIGGKGNVLDVIGAPGAASSDSFDAGVKEAQAKFPDIKLVGSVAGQWADTVTKTEVQKFLATNSGKIDGVITQPGSATGALQALQQSGRPVVPISMGGEAGAMCYWTKHPDFATQAFNIWPPGDEMQLGFEVAMRTLEQQGPKIQSIVRNISPLSLDYAKEKLGSDCDVNANGWIEPNRGEWFSGTSLDNFFQKPSDPLTWKPQS